MRRLLFANPKHIIIKIFLTKAMCRKMHIAFFIIILESLMNFFENLTNEWEIIWKRETAGKWKNLQHWYL